MNELIEIEKRELNPVTIFRRGGLDPLLDEIEREARSIVPDIETAKGRKAIASMAAKVARSKTYLDGLGKDLVADLKKQCGIVDADRRKLRDRLDELKADVRRPLTEWEDAEEARVQALKDRLEAMKSFDPDAGSAELEKRLDEVKNTPIDDSWDEFTAEAAQVKDAALFRLTAAVNAAKTYELAKAEKLRLDQEAAEQARKEREERIAREAAERERKAAEELARAEAERVERERLAEKQRQEAEARRQEQARLDAERRAKEAEQRAQEAEEQRRREAMAAAEKAKRDAEIAVRLERERAEAERQRKAAEDAKRAADVAHRKEVNQAAARALSTFAGISEKQAQQAVVAIAKGLIPNVKINY